MPEQHSTHTPPIILLTGASGQVGSELVRALAPLGQVVAPGRGELDLSDSGALRETTRSVRPALIVNAAAYTAVDRAESESESAFAINAVAPGVLADEAARTGAMIVHYSTDYVFDGAGKSPYTERDAPAPVNVYGESKLAGDLAVAASGAPYYILRTSWVYAASGHNFMRTMLRLAREREELRVVSDQIGSPTPAWLLAEVTTQLLKGHLKLGVPAVPRAGSGIYNATTKGHTSWHGFAERILELDPRRGEQKCRVVTAISTADFPTPARRPAYSVLDTTLLEHALGRPMPGWSEALKRTMAQMVADGGE